MLLLASQPDAAREKLLTLVEADDPNIASMSMFALGRTYVQLKQTDAAIATFRKLWTRYGESEMIKRAIFLVGQIYFDRGDFLEARKLYEACSVVGAAMQNRVRPGDELIVKVYDLNYFNRTRSTSLNVTLSAPSGDRETLKLEKNQVSDQLYIGRIRTALAMPTVNDGILQVMGRDVIEITYPGQSGGAYKVAVVDDGVINIDSIPLPEPPPRYEQAMARVQPPKPAGERPILPMSRQTSGTLNPGSPVYIQLIDADLDISNEPDTTMVEMVASGGGKENVVKVQLRETGPRTGIFIGSVNTASSGPTMAVSSEGAGHPAINAIDMDRDSLPPTTRPSTQPVKGPTFWQAKLGDKTPYLEIDLHQPAALGKIIWGAGSDPLAGRNMPTDLTITLKGDGPEKVLTLTNQSQPVGNVIDLKGAYARTIRFDITKWRGDAPAIGQVILTDLDGNQLIPSAIPAGSLAGAGVLEFNVGQSVFARYLDELNETPGTPVIRESRRLGARYHNGTLALVKPSGDDNRAKAFVPAWRLDLNAAPTSC